MKMLSYLLSLALPDMEPLQIAAALTTLIFFVKELKLLLKTLAHKKIYRKKVHATT